MNTTTAQDYPEKWVEAAHLEDGTLVCIRPIRPDDAPRLQETFKLLSRQTVYLRFLETFKELTDEQAQKFANVDYLHRMAFVGTIQQSGVEHIIGVARYDTHSRDHCHEAECAVVVRDDYQGLGLGRLLMTRLVQYAQQHDVHTFIGTILMYNAKVMNFIRGSGLPYERDMIEPGVWDVRVSLPKK